VQQLGRAVPALALLAAFQTRLGARLRHRPDTLQRRFLDSSDTITTSGGQVTVRIDRCACSPVLRQADLPDTTIPWWHGRLDFELTGPGPRSCMEVAVS
jgi:hypothetical protein